MDFNSALDIIIKDLGEARSIIDDFRKYKEVPLLQIELAKAKCRSAAEIIALLKDMPVKEEESPVPTVSHTVVPETEKTPDLSFRQPKTKPVAKTIIPPVEPLPPVEEPVVPAEKEREEHVPEKHRHNKVKPAGKEIFADRFKDVPGRVSDKVKALDPDADFTSRMQQSPIVNLADAVGINDKFYFIREVFGGDSHSYHEALTKLNSASGLKEAREILENYAGGTGNRDAVNDLLALVKRKTGDNE